MYGVLCWEAFTHGRSPRGIFGSTTPQNHENLLNLLEEGRRLRKPKSICSNEMYKLMLECWKEDPDDRPNFDIVLKKCL